MEPSLHTSAQPNKLHIWMLILLSWTSVFSLISVGLLLTKNSSNAISSADLSIACQNGTINGITTNLTRIAEACEDTDAQTTETVSGIAFSGSDNFLPDFTLPQNWTGYVFLNSVDATKPAVSFTGTKGIFTNCNECGGTGFPTNFWMASDTLANLNRVETFISSEFSLGSTDVTAIEAMFASKPDQFSNIDVASSPVANGTVIEVSGTYDVGGISAYAGAFHILQFTNATTVFELFSDGEDYEELKNSIDWSTIK